MFKSVTLRKAICLFPFMLFLVMSCARAQDATDIKDINPRAPNTPAMSRMEKQAQKKKIKQKKLAEKAIEIGKKRHEKLQTKEVRKRMRKSKHTASANNAHQREFFLKRWFQKKRSTKKR